MPFSKLPQFYLQRITTLLMSAVVITAGFLTFGNGLLFDRLFLATLVVLAVYFRHNKNLLSIFVIVALGRVFEELLWLMLAADWLLKWLAYTSAALIFWLLRYDTLAKVSLGVLAITLAAEVYWLASDYADTPMMHWYFVLIIQDLVLRHLLFLRPALLSKHFAKIESIPLDMQLETLYGLHIGTYFLVVSEFLVRHLAFHNSLVMYSTFPYVAQFLACAMIWIILRYLIKHSRRLQA